MALLCSVQNPTQDLSELYVQSIGDCQVSSDSHVQPLSTHLKLGVEINIPS